MYTHVYTHGDTFRKACLCTRRCPCVYICTSCSQTQRVAAAGSCPTFCLASSSAVTLASVSVTCCAPPRLAANSPSAPMPQPNSSTRLPSSNDGKRCSSAQKIRLQSALVGFRSNRARVVRKCAQGQDRAVQHRRKRLHHVSLMSTHAREPCDKCTIVSYCLFATSLCLCIYAG